MMKKGYVYAYLIPLSIACLIGTIVLHKAVKKAERLVTVGNEHAERIARFENAIAAASQQDTNNDVATPSIVEPALVRSVDAVKSEQEQAPELVQTADLGGAPSCADLSGLRQAVNPTSRGTPYNGQLLIANGTGARLKPCTRASAFGNTGSFSAGVLQPGKYQLPHGTLTVHSQR